LTRLGLELCLTQLLIVADDKVSSRPRAEQAKSSPSAKPKPDMVRGSKSDERRSARSPTKAVAGKSRLDRSGIADHLNVAGLQREGRYYLTNIAQVGHLCMLAPVRA